MCVHKGSCVRWLHVASVRGTLGTTSTSVIREVCVACGGCVRANLDRTAPGSYTLHSVRLSQIQIPRRCGDRQ